LPPHRRKASVTGKGDGGGDQNPSPPPSWERKGFQNGAKEKGGLWETPPKRTGLPEKKSP